MSSRLSPSVGTTSRERREVAEGGVAEEGRETVAEDAFGDDLVPVDVRAERRLRVVDVEQAEPLEPDPRVELAERLLERARVGDVDSRGPPVAGVEADAEPRVRVERVEEGGELRHRAADRAARAGGVLEAEPEPVRRQLEQVAERGRDRSRPPPRSRSRGASRRGRRRRRRRSRVRSPSSRRARRTTCARISASRLARLTR